MPAAPPQRPVDLPLGAFAAHIRGYAILTLDADGFVSSWNDGARLVKGYEEAEIIGSPYERFFMPEDAAAGRPAWILEQARTHGSYEEEGRRRREDGSSFWAHILITAIRDDRGEVIGFGKITEDLTDRKRAEDELRRRAEELERSNAELEQFAYVTSHDLSEPLRTITGYADVLQRRHGDELSPQARGHLERIGRASSRMQVLIDDLLDYSRAGRRGLELMPVALDEVVDERLDLLAAAVRKSGAAVAREPLPVVRGDRVLLGQLLQNLIGNALKFSEDAPHVTVGGVERDDTVVIYVADRGIGIADEHAERVFELFERLHARERYAGTGVGLAICRRIAERHGGRLRVRPREGGGTIAELELPR